MKRAFLITFKPNNENSELGWPLSKYKEVVNDFQTAGSVEHNWRFNSHKKMSSGDRVFLALQGHNGPAILGYGKVVGEATNKDGPWRAPIHFEMIVDPETEILATKEELKAITTEHSVWGAQASGNSLPQDVAEALEDLVVGRTPIASNMNFLDKGRPALMSDVSQSTIRSLFSTFAEVYPDVRQSQKFGVHDELWKILGKITNKIHANIQDIPGNTKIKIQWSLGKGVWVNIPWIALMHADETDTTQKGLYCCYLFAEDMSSVVLTLSIGATEYLNKHTPKVAHEVMADVCNKYSDYFLDLEEFGFLFDQEMSLSSSGNLGKSYEHGAVTYKKYHIDNLPSDEILQRDLHQLVDKYIDFINNHAKPSQIDNPSQQRVWSLGLGEGARHFDEFYDANKIAIGWDAIGNLEQYQSAEDYLEPLKIAYPEMSPNPTNNAKACFEFAHQMHPGDLVFIKKGKTHVVAYGIVTGEYSFEDQRPYYKNTRSIQWQGRGEWKIPEKFATKTLTNITDYPKFVEILKETVGMEHKSVPKAIKAAESFSLEQALEGVFLPREEFIRALRIWKAKKNLILQGPPGVGKSFIAENLSFALMGTKNREALKRIQFHQSYSYEDFIQGYRPTDSGFILKDGVFTKFCNQAASDPNQIYVFVIDEINRGNLSKILGELMVLIEPDKRGPKWEMPLTYNEEPFYVPDNLYILGMMNTADRSLSLVDYALRRRFAFMEIKPQFESTQFKEFMRSKGADDRLIDFIINSMRKLNDAIREETISLGEGFCIGHSYFCPSTSTTLDLNWYRDQIEAEIIPLLKEYWFDDHKKVDEWSKNLLEKFD